MKKRILFLPRWYPNKTDIQLGTFIRQQALLMKDDYEVSVIYVQADPTAADKFTVVENKKEGIHELVVYFKTSSGLFRKITNVKRYEKAQALAFAKIAGEPHLCHVHVPWRSAGLAMKLQRKHQTPFVITEHWSGHLNGEYAALSNFEKMFNKAVLEKATAISAVSQLLQKSFKTNTGFNSVVIPNYIESDSNKAPHNRGGGQIQLLTVSDMADGVKNISGLINAFHAALKENSKLHLTLIGGGPDEEKIKSLVNTLGLQSSVTFNGRCDHAAVLNAMHACHFYVCNSNFETFGMTVAEALRAGKPVVSSKCGGPEEFLHPGNSVVVDKQNNAQLTGAILEMSKKFQDFDAEKIALEMEEKFGRDLVKEKWISFYNSAMGVNG